MAIKSIDDLIAPVGMTEKENQKGLKTLQCLKRHTNQGKKGMEFFSYSFGNTHRILTLRI